MKSINLMKNIGQFTPTQNRQVRLTHKSSVRFTPPKSPSPIYPQIICMIYPPKIAKSDLPSNHLYDLLNIKNLYIIILSIFRVHF